MELSVHEVLDGINYELQGKAEVTLKKNTFIVKSLVSQETVEVARIHLLDRAYEIMCEPTISDFKKIIKFVCLNLIYFNTEDVCEIEGVVGYED